MSQKQINRLIVVSVVLFVLVIGLGTYLLMTNITDEGDEVTTSIGQIMEEPLTEFTFVDNTGQPLSLSDLEGKHVLLSFGYTRCPDVCPVTLLSYRQIMQDLGDSADEVAFVFISVDPERDTPDVLDRYVTRFDESIIGLQGDEDQLQVIKDDYGLFYDYRDNENSQAGYLVDHTASKFLIDPAGNLIRVYSFAAEERTIAAEIRRLL